MIVDSNTFSQYRVCWVDRYNYEMMMQNNREIPLVDAQNMIYAYPVTEQVSAIFTVNRGVAIFHGYVAVRVLNLFCSDKFFTCASTVFCKVYRDVRKDAVQLFNECIGSNVDTAMARAINFIMFIQASEKIKTLSNQQSQ